MDWSLDEPLPTNMASSWAANTCTLYFFQSQRNWRKVFAKLKLDSPAAMAKLAIDPASIVFGNKSGDFHSKSGDQEIFIILSKIGRSPEKSGDLEALMMYFNFN